MSASQISVDNGSYHSVYQLLTTGGQPFDLTRSVLAEHFMGQPLCQHLSLCRQHHQRLILRSRMRASKDSHLKSKRPPFERKSY
jgi:hypothetical protein